MVRSNPEALLQVSIVNYLRLFDDLFVFAVPNGGSRHKLEAINLKRQGVISGVSDLIIMIKDEVIFVELKLPVKHSILSPTQNAFAKICKKFGHGYVVWRSIDDAINFVNERIR